MKPEEFRQVYDLMTLDDEADCRILSGIGKMAAGGQKMENRKYKKKCTKAVVAAVVAILAVGSGGYAASLAWNGNVAERFGVEDKKEMMQELSDKGFSKKLESENTADGAVKGAGNEGDVLSVTDKDITVTVRQTLADEHCGYIYYEVEYGEEYTPVVDGADELSDYGIAWAAPQLTTDADISYSSGVMKIINDHKIGYECFFCFSDPDRTFHGNLLNMKIKYFYMDKEKADAKPERIAEGNWTLSWKISNGTQKRVYQIDRTVKIDGMDMYFEKLEVSPLSCKAYVVTKDKKFMELSDKLEEPGLEKLQCGENTFQGNGGGGYMVPKHKKNGKTYIVEQKEFDKILDLDALTGFYYGNRLITLEDVEYTVEE